jgi:hypothetical protein
VRPVLAVGGADAHEGEAGACGVRVWVGVWVRVRVRVRGADAHEGEAGAWYRYRYRCGVCKVGWEV